MVPNPPDPLQTSVVKKTDLSEQESQSGLENCVWHAWTAQTYRKTLLACFLLHDARWSVQTERHIHKTVWCDARSVMKLARSRLKMSNWAKKSQIGIWRQIWLLKERLDWFINSSMQKIYFTTYNETKAIYRLVNGHEMRQVCVLKVWAGTVHIH